MSIIKCCKCGEPIQVSAAQEVMLRRSQIGFYCLWGHCQSFKVIEKPIEDAPSAKMLRMLPGGLMAGKVKQEETVEKEDDDDE